MKSKIIFMLLWILWVNSFGQDNGDDEDFRTIFRDQPIQISGFGGPMMSFSTLDNQFAHMMGGGGGLLINNIWIGGYGMGLTTSLDYPIANNDSARLNFGHGGLWFGYIHNPNEAIHPAFHVMVGWGGYGEREDYENERSFNCFVLVPTLELEFNFFEFFKLGVGANYRYVTNVQKGGIYSGDDLSGPGAFLSFKFGWFDHYR